VSTDIADEAAMAEPFDSTPQARSRVADITLMLACELRGWDITVNAVAPGLTAPAPGRRSQSCQGRPVSNLA
jgi:NAD(P)-dependent dehydrogenase (short-subunit alcohol dehydrogenase family)